MQIRISNAETANYLCRCCGSCCKGDIPIYAPEVVELSKVTGLKIKKLVKQNKYTPLGSIYTIGDYNDDCIFLRDSRCQIYEHRPLICQKFPLEFSLRINGLDLQAAPYFSASGNDACVGLPEEHKEGVRNILLPPEQMLKILEKAVRLKATRARISRVNGIERFVHDSFELFNSLSLEEAANILFENKTVNFTLI